MNVSLFSKAVPPVDPALIGLTIPRNDFDLKMVARVQDHMRELLGEGELIVRIGAGVNSVFIATHKRVLVYKGERFEREIPLTGIADISVGQWRGFPATVTASPSIRVPFVDASDAFRFAAALDTNSLSPIDTAFFEEILDTVGIKSTATNLSRVAERMAAAISAGAAFPFLEQVEDLEGQLQYRKTFLEQPQINGLQVPDAMIRWLWQRDLRFHEPLHLTAGKVREALITPGCLYEVDGEIPLQEW